MTIRPKKKQCKDKSECEIADHSKSTLGHIDQLPCSSWQLQDNVTDDIDVNVQTHKRRHRSPIHCSRLNRLKNINLRKVNDIPLAKKVKKDVSSTQNILRLPIRNASIAARVPPTKLPNPNVKNEGNETHNSEDEYEMTSNFEDKELELWFTKELKEKRNFVIKSMKEDGACLFRAVAEQVFGDQEMHNIVRNNCVDHMCKNADFFKQYITEDFDTYLQRKRLANTHGNHIEIQAISEIYNRPVEVFRYEIEPINTFHLSYATENAPIRLSYHGNIHYNAVIDPNNATIGVGLGLPGHQPGLADKELIDNAINHSEKTQIEETMLKDKLRETDWELTQEAIEEQASRESYLQWLKDEGSRARESSGGPSYNNVVDSKDVVPAANFNPANERSASHDRASASEDTWWQELPTNDPSDPKGQKVTNSQTKDHQRSGKSTVNNSTSGKSSKTPLLISNPGYGTEMGDWGDDEDVMARVLAESQQEYFDSCKSKNG